MGVAAITLVIAWLTHQGDHILPIPSPWQVAHLNELAKGGRLVISKSDLQHIDELLPIGWALGDRYSESQWIAPEKYC